MAGGRPSKLTDELCDEFLKEIRDGVPESTAAQLVGLNRNTITYWKNKAKESKRKNRYTEFLGKLEGAKAFANKTHLKAIMESKDWKARKYLLTLNDKFYMDVEKVKLEHSGEIKEKHEGTIELNIHDRIKEYEKRFKDMDTAPEGSDSSDGV
jgi:transposase